MTAAQINAFCATLPGADLSAPFGEGHDVWKVGGKIFAMIGARRDGVSLKCADPETAGLLIEMGRAKRAPYLPRGGWVFFSLGSLEADEMQERLTTSYLTVRRSLSRKMQASLGPESQV